MHGSKIERVGEEVVAIVFRRQEIRRQRQPTNKKRRDACADGAQDPGDVEPPVGHVEVIVVLEHVALTRRGRKFVLAHLVPP